MKFKQNFDYNELSDEEIVFKIKSGCTDLLQVLFKRYLGIIRKKASTNFPSADHDDLIQEGLIALYSATNVFDGSISSFSTFASVCIDRAMCSEYRKLFSKKRVPSNRTVPLDNLDSIISNNNPELQLIEKEECMTFTAKIKNSLSEFEYNVLLLYLVGNSYESIADNFDVDIKSVNNAMSRLRKKIKAIN